MVRALQFHLSAQWLYVPLLQHCYTTVTTLLTLEKYIFVGLCIYGFLLLFVRYQ